MYGAFFIFLYKSIFYVFYFSIILFSWKCYVNCGELMHEFYSPSNHRDQLSSLFQKKKKQQMLCLRISKLKTKSKKYIHPIPNLLAPFSPSLLLLPLIPSPCPLSPLQLEAVLPLPLIVLDPSFKCPQSPAHSQTKVCPSWDGRGVELSCSCLT